MCICAHPQLELSCFELIATVSRRPLANNRQCYLYIFFCVVRWSTWSRGPEGVPRLPRHSHLLVIFIPRQPLSRPTLRTASPDESKTSPSLWWLLLSDWIADPSRSGTSSDISFLTRATDPKTFTIHISKINDTRHPFLPLIICTD